jgi:hypothetical protein
MARPTLKGSQGAALAKPDGKRDGKEKAAGRRLQEGDCRKETAGRRLQEGDCRKETEGRRLREGD